MGASGVYFSDTGGSSWVQPTYTGWTARDCLGLVGTQTAAADNCDPHVGPIGTLPRYLDSGLVADGLLAGGILVQVWDTTTKILCEPSLTHREKVTVFAFSPEGPLAATGSEDGAVRIWDTAKGEIQGQPLEHSAPVRGVVFSPHGKYLLTWSANNNVRLWDLASGQPMGPLLQHPDEITAAVFTPDSQAIIVVSGKAAWLWDVVAGKRLGPPLPVPHLSRP